MKRTKLIKMFKDNGWWVLREGANHVIMTNGIDIEPVPRHRDIDEMLARAIIKRRNLR